MRLAVRNTGFVGAVLVAAVLGAAGLLWAAPTPLMARVSFAQDSHAFAYLRFDNNRLRVARTLGTLDSAKPVRSKSGDISDMGGDAFYQFYDFPEVSLPISVKGLEKVTGEFHYSRSRSTPGRSKRPARNYTNVGGHVTLARHEGAATWGYVVSVNDVDRPGATAKDRLELKVPDVGNGDLTFEVVTKVEGRKARLGIQAKAGNQDLYTITKNGKGIPVKLEVLDKDHRVVVSEQGDPVKFGFT